MGDQFAGTPISFIGMPAIFGTRFVSGPEAGEERTVPRFRHGRWRAMTDFFAICSYHWGRCMRSIEAYCATGRGTPFGTEDG